MRCCFKKGYFVIIILCYVVLLSCAGSGGGTSGTGGGGGFTISGTLKTNDHTPLSGVQVSVSTGVAGVQKISLASRAELDREDEQDVTDEEGIFSVSLAQRPDSFALLFQDESFESSVEVVSVPAVASQVNLQLLFDDLSQTVLTESEQFEDKDGNEVNESQEDESHE